MLSACSKQMASNFYSAFFIMLTGNWNETTRHFTIFSGISAKTASHAASVRLVTDILLSLKQHHTRSLAKMPLLHHG